MIVTDSNVGAGADGMATAPSDGSKRHSSLAERLRRSRLMPQKKARHVCWHGIRFRMRTLIFVACVLFLMTFVIVSFGTGAGNGQWIYEASEKVMDWTFLPLASLMESSQSTMLQTIGHGLESFVGVDIVGMFLATFVLSVIATAAITIVTGIIRTMHYADDDGNVALLRGYDEQYKMGQMLR